MSRGTIKNCLNELPKQNVKLMGKKIITILHLNSYQNVKIGGNIWPKSLQMRKIFLSPNVTVIKFVLCKIQAIKYSVSGVYAFLQIDQC